MATKSKLLTEAQQKKIEALRAAAILLSIDVESNFKLYSYRIVDHDQFVQRLEEIIGLYNNTKNQVNGQEIFD